MYGGGDGAIHGEILRTTENGYWQSGAFWGNGWLRSRGQ